MLARADDITVDARGSVAEQVGVRAGSGKEEFVPGAFVDQQPVGRDVALAPAFPFALEGMVAVGFGEWFTTPE